MTHTQGPWGIFGGTIVDQRENEIASIIKYGAWIGGNTPYGRDNLGWRANARLIASAPDMLAALIEVQQMLEAGENNAGTYETISNAINKALGDEQ